MMAVKKATVDFVLRDPNDTTADAKEVQTTKRTELSQQSVQWKLTYDATRTRILKNLHTVNPLLAQILYLWHKQYRYDEKIKF